jgi:hypothetical protein
MMIFMGRNYALRQYFFGIGIDYIQKAEVCLLASFSAAKRDGCVFHTSSKFAWSKQLYIKYFNFLPMHIFQDTS